MDKDGSPLFCHRGKNLRSLTVEQVGHLDIILRPVYIGITSAVDNCVHLLGIAGNADSLDVGYIQIQGFISLDCIDISENIPVRRSCRKAAKRHSQLPVGSGNKYIHTSGYYQILPPGMTFKESSKERISFFNLTEEYCCISTL